MTAFLIVVTFIIAYLLGSIPTAYIVGRFRKKTDIRTVGSRNMGAMNVFYSVGFWWGALTLAVDIGKGVLAMVIANLFNIPQLAYLATGIIVILGHNFPVFLKFRGGKGGATAVGVLSYIMFPFGFLIGLAIFTILMLITRFPTLSYGIGLISFPFSAWLHYHWGWGVVFSVVIVAIPFVRYIPRLKEIYKKAGSLRHAVQRKNLKDRF
ncbi:MAG: glycerol-3-phosphate acyltransferase [Dehalococcoidales bacterium]|nr:glycerol-3-phosphate acyltransferase [Dehalococcoidales bacterium]